MKKILITLVLLVTLLSGMLWAGLFDASKMARPDKIIGLYISYWTMGYPKRALNIVGQAKEFGVNTLVCDFRGKPGQTYLNNLKAMQEAGYYTVARIVVFEEGVGADYKTAQDSGNWQAKLDLCKEAQALGFNEVQLDYIRFADAGWADPKKEEIVTKFISAAKAAVTIPVGADVFGSVAYQAHRVIGQNMTTMSQIIDAVSPMLYPSHFSRDRKRMSQPYETMLEGSTFGLQKTRGTKARMIPYIQGFPMLLSYSGMNLKDYIKAQLNAVEDAGTDGFYVWHAGNDYSTTFAALKEHGKMYANPPKPYDEIKRILGITTNATTTAAPNTLPKLGQVPAAK